MTNGWVHAATLKPYATELWVLDEDTGELLVEEREPNGELITQYPVARSFESLIQILDREPEYTLSNEGRALRARWSA